MTTKIRKEEPIEIIVIDSDKFIVELTNMLFDYENVEHDEFIGFSYPNNALNYLRECEDKTPKLILLETIDNSGQHDFSFFEEYSILKRRDFIYVVTVSIDERDKTKCLSYEFVRKYIDKPLTVDDIRDMVKEHGLNIKKINKVVGE